MKTQLLDRAIDLSERVGHALLATTDEEGTPHVAAVGRLSHPNETYIAVDDWFCPGTLENLQRHDSRISIIAWDPEDDTGYQLLGTMEALMEESIMDGYIPGQEREQEHAAPQVQRRLVVRVDEVLNFSKRSHRDLPAELET